MLITMLPEERLVLQQSDAGDFEHPISVASDRIPY